MCHLPHANMCVCKITCTCTCTPTSTCTHKHILPHSHTHMHTHGHTVSDNSSSSSSSKPLGRQTLACMFATPPYRHVRAHTQVNAHTNIYFHTHTHTHAHTCTHSRRPLGACLAARQAVMPPTCCMPCLSTTPSRSGGSWRAPAAATSGRGKTALRCRTCLHSTTGRPLSRYGCLWVPLPLGVLCVLFGGCHATASSKLWSRCRLRKCVSTSRYGRPEALSGALVGVAQMLSGGWRRSIIS